MAFVPSHRFFGGATVRLACFFISIIPMILLVPVFPGCQKLRRCAGVVPAV